MRTPFKTLLRNSGDYRRLDHLEQKPLSAFVFCGGNFAGRHTDL